MDSHGFMLPLHTELPLIINRNLRTNIDKTNYVDHKYLSPVLKFPFFVNIPRNFYHVRIIV